MKVLRKLFPRPFSSADYWSVFFSPAVSFGGGELGSPEIGLRYAGVWNEGHSFAFAESSADLTVDDSFSNFFEASLSVDMALGNGVTLTPGLAVSYAEGGSLDMTLVGAPTSADTLGGGLAGRVSLGLTTDTGLGANIAVYKREDGEPIYAGGIRFAF